MELKSIPLTEICPYENNPRRNEAAVTAVAESIKQCGYVAPIIIDENNVILAGHTRYKALQLLEADCAEVLIKSGLTEEQKRKYRLLDNKTAELSGWDFDKLIMELEGLDFENLLIDWGIDTDEGLDDQFELPSGDRESSCCLTFSLSLMQKEAIEKAISEMKKTAEYKAYKDPENNNSNGNALYLLVMRGWNQ